MYGLIVLRSLFLAEFIFISVASLGVERKQSISGESCVENRENVRLNILFSLEHFQIEKKFKVSGIHLLILETACKTGKNECWNHVFEFIKLLRRPFFGKPLVS